MLVGRPAGAQIEVTEASIRELQQAMESGRATSADITRAYLARIGAYDHAGPRLNAMIRLNPNALAEAEALDRERAERGSRGPLHGIPVILKDNYDTYDMPTSGGSVALAGLQPPDDAFQVRKLREAGVVILGKSNLHELASGITTISSLGGQTLNPYDLRRNPGGSSGGTGAAIASSFAAVGWGSDTCGSIRIPASHNNLVGLRPTKGLSSIDGILPLAHTQDVGGPLARSVEDLAIALDATVGPDPADPATEALRGRDVPRFADALDENALDGIRIGVLDALFGEAPEDRAVTGVVRDAVRRMEDLGATAESLQIDSLQELLAGSGVIGMEFKWDLMDYLASVPNAPVGSLQELLDLGLLHEAVAPLMRRWNAPETRTSPEYSEALANRDKLRDAVLSAMNARSLDVVAYPTIRRLPAQIGEPQPGTSCQLSAQTGMPALSVPAGWSDGLPVGIELLARPFEDARLISFGYALEHASDQRRPPSTTPPLVDNRPPPPLVGEVRAVGAGGPEVTAHLSYEAATRTLAYEIDVAGARAEDVYAVVLREEGDGEYVAASLTGPGVVSAEGRLSLSPSVGTRLEAGELSLELVTRGQPVRTARSPVVLDRP